LCGRATSRQENWRGLWRVKGRVVKELHEIRFEQEHPEHPEKFKH